MKKLLVTGGTTFVSKYIDEYFVNAGYEVYVLNRNTKPQVCGVKLIEGDSIADSASIDSHSQIFGTEPHFDVVFSLIKDPVE